MDDDAERKGLSRWRLPLLGSAVVVLHFATVLYQYPIGLALAGRALASGDSGITLGKAWDASRCAESGGFVGYSPSFMAGYHCGVWDSVGHRGYELGTTYLPFGPAPTNYYWTVVGMTCLIPLLLGLAGRACGYCWTTALGCAAFSSVVVQLCDPVSFFWSFGNTAFPFGSALAVLAVSCALPGGRQMSFPRAALAGFLAGVAVWAHTVAAIPLLCGAVAAVAIALRSRVPPLRLAALVAAAVGVGLTVVLPGHFHLLAFLEERSPMAIQPLPSGLKYLVSDLLTDRAYRHPLDRRPFFHVLLAFSTWQAWIEWRERAGRSEGLWLAGVVTLAFGYACGHVPLLRQLQPYRFVVSGDLFLVVPAWLGLCRFAARIKAATPASRAAVAVLGAAFAPSLLGYGLDAATRERAAPLTAEEMECVEWIRSQPEGGRVLCEPSALGCLLPHLTNREVIGGAVNGQAVVIQGWTHVGEGRAFGKAMGDVSPAEFLANCRLLDIRILMVDTDLVERLIVRMPADLKRETQIGRIRIYRLAPAPAEGIWEGCYQGKVRVTHNRIRIDDPPVGKFVIDYHYVQGFQTEPGVAVEPVEIAGASAPFLGIVVTERKPSIELTFRSGSW